MLRFVLSATLLLHVAPALAASDRTDAFLNDFRRSGLELVRTDALAGGMTLRLYLTGGARALIKDSRFDVPDERFDLNVFAQYVVETFQDSVAAFAAIVPKPVIKELNVVIEDKGQERQNTISEA